MCSFDLCRDSPGNDCMSTEFLRVVSGDFIQSNFAFWSFIAVKYNGDNFFQFL